MQLDLDAFKRDGWLRVAGAVPLALCEAALRAMESSGVPLRDPAAWDGYVRAKGDLVPLWGHQALWDIRQHPTLHRVWSQAWGSEALLVSLDSCRFSPPWRPGQAKPFGLHWDRDPAAPGRMIQGVVALTDTAADQGGFRCVPSLFGDPAAWPREPAAPDDWLAPVEGREIVSVPAEAGDLIIWDSRLPHGNGVNRAALPRLAFYLQMFPTAGADPKAGVESWQSGRCVPWWRDRSGYDRVEPWPPAELTALGRRLLGLDPWPNSPALPSAG